MVFLIVQLIFHLGSIPWFFVTELFTQRARGAASSVAIAVNWMANFTVGLLFPLMQVIVRAKMS